MPCWKIERRRVLQINKSAHWTMTTAVKNIVWQVNSTILRCEYDHSCPYESTKLLLFLSSQSTRRPMRSPGKKPF